MGAAHRSTRGRGMILEDVLKRTDSMVTVEARHWAWAPFLGEVRTASNDDRRLLVPTAAVSTPRWTCLAGRIHTISCVVAPRFSSRMAVAYLVPYAEVQEWPVKVGAADPHHAIFRLRGFSKPISQDRRV